MTFIKISFFVFLLIILILYYVLPIKYRWVVLLCGNIGFILKFYHTGWWIIAFTVAVTYAFGLVIDRLSATLRKMFFVIGIVLICIPWVLAKYVNALRMAVFGQEAWFIIIPVGISFYTLWLIAYLTDIYTGKIRAQNNPFKLGLFATFFPQLVQGPIPRYDQLQKQLIEGNRFDENKITHGIYMIIWGFFLKMMIADKAGVIVDTVFDGYQAYGGAYVWIASILYSIQLYTDFLAYTTISRGIAMLFGIELANNFARPYFASSIKEFWSRWHISLSTWLRDYIYIPLGGNRKGKIRKRINLVITFMISGIWHGAGLNFLIWGFLHAIYQIFEDMRNSTASRRNKASIIITFLLVNFAWVLFRADSLNIGLNMLGSMLTVFNPWVLFNNRIFSLGLSWKQVIVLGASIILLWRVEIKQERGVSVRDSIVKMKTPLRWTVLILAVIGIVVFGTYGYGFNAQDFIYGGF